MQEKLYRIISTLLELSDEMESRISKIEQVLGIETGNLLDEEIKTLKNSKN